MVFPKTTGMVFPILTQKDPDLRYWSLLLLSHATLVLLLHPHPLSENSSVQVMSGLLLVLSSSALTPCLQAV